MDKLDACLLKPGVGGTALFRPSSSFPNDGVVVLFGSQSNAIAAGCLACTISGGGTTNDCTGFGGGDVSCVNEITSGVADYATITGGYNNVIGASVASAIVGGAHQLIDNANGHGFIGGGSGNTVTGAGVGYGTVVGGSDNTVSGNHGTVGGGATNTASGIQSTVAGGSANSAGGTGASVGGGATNTIATLTDYATISGGNGNSISGGGNAVYTTVVGGRSNTVGTVATYASVLGGRENTTNAHYAATQGYQASTVANWYGVNCLGSGRFAANGDAQTCRGVLRRQTTDATVTTLYLDGVGTGSRLAIPTDTTWTFSILIVTRRTDANNESAGYKCEGVIDNNAGTTALVGAVITTVLAEDTVAWDISCNATDGATDALEVTVTGEAAKTINWVGSVTLSQVTG